MADLRTEMTTFLKQGDKPAEKQTETKQEESTDTSKDEGQLDESADETQEHEDKPDEGKTQEDSDDSEEKDSEKDSKDDKKKPNRYQRLKSQRDEALAATKQTKEHFYKAVKVANAWRAEAKMLEAELGKIKEQAKAKGLQRTPEQEQLFDYERQHAVRKVEEEFDKQAQQDKLQDDAKAFIGALRERFSDDASAMESKYGVGPTVTSSGERISGSKRILKRLLEERNAGNMISMEDVAKELRDFDDFRKRKSGDSRQLEVSRSAPRTMRPGSPAKIDYPATTEGMAAFLHSLGKKN